VDLPLPAPEVEAWLAKELALLAELAPTLPLPCPCRCLEPTAPGVTLETVIARYSRPAMARVWSDESKLARWLDVELAALDGWAAVGAVPTEAVADIRRTAAPPSPARVAELEARTQHDTAAFVDAVAERLGPAGRWFHYGLTSSDVVDTALALQIQQAGGLVLEGVERAFDAVVARAEEHRATLIVGRTHGVHAEPTTFGLKLAGWAFELERGRNRAALALAGARVGKLSGAVGNYANVDPEVERIACEQLGLEPAPSSTQILGRDRHAEVLGTLALVAASLEKFAVEIRHLARTEVGEVEEPFARGQKGSSAMPHKRNPIVAERICGLARVLRAHALVGLENVALWHERDISHSAAERIVLPDAFLALDYMLDRFAWLVEGLVVRPDRMRANLEASHGLVFSQRLLTALVDAGLARDDAYRLVQGHALRAWESERHLRGLVDADPEIAGRVDLDRVFDPNAFTRHVDTIFERLHALDRRQEAVHA
jgi:adenylosuccinate lyase